MTMYSKNTFRVIEFLLRNRTSEFNVNQIAKDLKMSLGGVHKILKSLFTKGIVAKEELGNATYYSMNLQDKEAKKLSELVLIEAKTRLLNSNSRAKVYASDLEKAGNFAKAMILFGSILDVKAKARDVDVLFLVEKKDVKKVEDFCLEISAIRPKQVIPMIMTVGDFQRNLKKADKVVAEILRKGIVLAGEDVIVNSLEGE